MDKSEKKTKKVGLALGGGGARGLAHVGVIKALERAGIKIDFIAGTSMGALVGGFYAATGDIRKLEDLFLKIKNKDVFPVRRLFKKKDGVLFKDGALAEFIESEIKDIRLENCKIPFRAIATEASTGDEVVLEKGNLVSAIRASIAIPMVFPPIEINKHLLMDGGFSNPVPADVVRQMAAEMVIAVDVSSEWHKISEDEMNPFHFYEVILHAMSIVEHQLARHALKSADVIVRPPVMSFNWLSFNEAQEIIRTGEKELNNNLKEILFKGGYPEPQKTPFEKFMDFLFVE